MSDKKVTVFVTVYNIEPYLERFFECLERQTYTEYKVLIIDDGSTDNSLEICKKYAEGDDRISIVETEHIGISAARNIAFSKIETPYAASLDGDDYFGEDYLKHLMEAEEKYGADLVISNVVLVGENGKERERFAPRNEELFLREDFETVVPALLEEHRMNFLYTKLYKTELLKDIRVESDVMQGSDTMINFMYLENCRSIAVIEDYDYSYVQYRNRSVTSYSGGEFFNRLYRINKFVLDEAEKQGILNDEMLRVVDGRILYSGKAFLTRIGRSDDSLENKYRLAESVLNSGEYLSSYNRQKELGNLDSYRSSVIPPSGGRKQIDIVWSIEKAERKSERLGRLREVSPDFVYHIWHGAKKILGITRKD